MRLGIRFSLVVLLALPPIVIIDGCSKEPTLEEKRADSTLVVAKSQLNLGNHRVGRTLLLSALSLDLKLGRTQQLAEEYGLLGHLCGLSAEFDSAIGYFNKGIEQYRSLIDRRNARALLLEVASIHRQMGEERVAYEMYAEALRLATVFKDEEGMRELQFALLPACRALEKIEEHAQIASNLMGFYAQSGDRVMQARVHLETARSFSQRREYGQAIDPLLQALTFAEQAGDSVLVITILSTLASTYDKSGNTRQSFETYTDALTRADHTSDATKLRLEMLIRVGNIYLRSSHVAEAERFYRAALGSAISLKNKLAEGYLIVQLGQCALGMGRSEEANKDIQGALELFAPTAYAPALAFANASMGIVSQRNGRSNEATDYFKRSIEQIEMWRGQTDDLYNECESTALKNISYHDLLTSHLLQIGRTDEAFWYAEKNVQHSLQRKLSALDLRTRDDLVNTLFGKLRHFRALQVGAEQQLASVLANGPDDKTLRAGIVAQLKKAEVRCEDLGAAILKEDPPLEPAILFNGASIADVQRQLPPGTALLRNIPTSRSVYAYVITNSRATVNLSPFTRERLGIIVSDFGGTLCQLEALVDSPAIQRLQNDQRLQDLSSQLYAALIRPAEPSLKGITHLLVVPNPGDPLIPIQALRRGGAFTSYSVEQFDITYIPSCTALNRHKVLTVPVREVVGLGHPGMTSWDVEYELRDVRAFYKDARLYFGQQASLGTLQRERGDLLHLALDLRYSARSPENAYTLFSDHKARGLAKETRWGEFLSISAFNTTVLSHLQADSIHIDQILPALFLMSGSSRVIVNSYPLARKAKKMFGELFYTSLLAGKSSESAYRQALLDMIKNPEYASPSMWAPFSIWGW